MRRFLTLVLLLPAVAALARAADVDFVRVWPAWRDGDSFVRISEYFTGRENTGRETVVRTHPDARDGYYFLTRVRSDHAIAGARFVLDVVTPGDPAPKSYTFAADVADGSHVFQLGLTGGDWPAKNVHPVAWHLELQSADGKVIAAKSSFLWEKPATP